MIRIEIDCSCDHAVQRTHGAAMDGAYAGAEPRDSPVRSAGYWVAKLLWALLAAILWPITVELFCLVGILVSYVTGGIGWVLSLGLRLGKALAARSLLLELVRSVVKNPETDAPSIAQCRQQLVCGERSSRPALSSSCNRRGRGYARAAS